MNHCVFLAASLAGLSVAACTPRVTGPEPAQLPVDPGPSASASSWTFSAERLDPSVDACHDFYQHACGGWIASTTVDAARPAAFLARDDFNRNLESAMGTLLASGGDTPKSADLERLRTFFASCIDSAQAGGTDEDEATLRRWTARVDAATSSADLQGALRELHGIAVHAFFVYSGQPDLTDSTRYRGEIHEGTLFATPQLVTSMFVASGASTEEAKTAAAIVTGIEAELRAHSMPWGDRWEVDKANHPHSIAQLQVLAPHVAWSEYMAEVGSSEAALVNVTSPRYLQAVDHVFASRKPEELRTYLHWSLLASLSRELPKRYVETLASVPPPKKCREAAMRALGIEFSRTFSEQILGPEARAAGQHIAHEIRASFVDALATREWLSQGARSATAAKLSKTDLKIGFPDAWPTSGSFSLAEDRFLDNVLAARAFETRREWSRAQATRSRHAWEMTVYPNEGAGMAAARLMIPNGFPDAFSNSIMMTAAYLMPPTLDKAAPIEVNYGTFGATFGHELVHVAEAHMFGAAGEAAQLWTEADIEAEREQGGCVVDQAASFEPFEGGSMDGEDQFGENVADYGGVRLAYRVLATELGVRLHERGPDGITPAQRFFYARAHNHCEARTLESLQANVKTDGHAPAAFRVNAPLSNLPVFAEAFGCESGDAMVRAPEAICEVW